jgi:hypothetical protein
MIDKCIPQIAASATVDNHVCIGVLEKRYTINSKASDGEDGKVHGC